MAEATGRAELAAVGCSGDLWVVAALVEGALAAGIVGVAQQVVVWQVPADQSPCLPDK